MTRRLSLRRFPDVIVRRRQGPGGVSHYGEFAPGPIVRTALPALIQPVKLDDDDQEGGVHVLRRTKVYVPTGIERVSTADAALTWHGEVLLWGGEPLVWGGFMGYRAGDENPLAAGFEDRGADEVEIGSTVYVVVENETWPGSHCRATLLRET